MEGSPPSPAYENLSRRRYLKMQGRRVLDYDCSLEQTAHDGPGARSARREWGSLSESDIYSLLMEIKTMFSRFMQLAPIQSSQDHRTVQKCRCPRASRCNRDSIRAQFQLEGLEERCLLSSISSISEFAVPGVGAGQSITSGPDGNVWFTEPGPNAIGMINLTTHVISSFAVPTPGAGLNGITAGPDGNLWFTESGGKKIGTIDPTTHAISEYSLPTASNHPVAITAGPDGNLWFTKSGAGPKQLGEINPSTHVISEFPVSTSQGLWGITAGPDGNVWFAMQADEVGRINPTTHAVSLFPTLLGQYGIAAGPDGNIWFAQDFSSYRIGAINPTTHATSGFADSGAPYGITGGPDGNVWFADEDGRIGQINPTTDVITEYSIPFAGSSPYGITTGPDGNLWFTDDGTSSIGVATLATSQLMLTAQPPSSVTAGSGFGLTVTAEDSSGNAINSFNGTVTVALATNPGGATLGGTLTATASNGITTFSGLTLTTAASGYTLFVSGGGYGWGVTNAITVTPAAPSHLLITTEPPATVKLNGSFGLQASIEDQYGNVVTTDTNTVKVAFASNPTGATLSGTLSVAASQGVATFSGLGINKTGTGYTLQVTSSGLSSADSSAIDVTNTGKAIATPPAPTGTTAPDALLAPLVFDSPGFLDSLVFKKRTRGT
jgi:streptogramin lyase